MSSDDGPRSVSAQVASDLDRIGDAGSFDETLRALAMTLAGQVDSGEGVASAARELRAVLAELAKGANSGDPADPEADLSSPV